VSAAAATGRRPTATCHLASATGRCDPPPSVSPERCSSVYGLARFYSPRWYQQQESEQGSKGGWENAARNVNMLRTLGPPQQLDVLHCAAFSLHTRATLEHTLERTLLHHSLSLCLTKQRARRRRRRRGRRRAARCPPCAAARRCWRRRPTRCTSACGARSLGILGGGGWGERGASHRSCHLRARGVFSPAATLLCGETPDGRERCWTSQGAGQGREGGNGQWPCRTCPREATRARERDRLGVESWRAHVLSS
jgi:hypothetical protein